MGAIDVIEAILPELERDLQRAFRVKVEQWADAIAVLIDDHPEIFIKPSPIEGCRNCVYVTSRSLELLAELTTIAKQLKPIFISLPHDADCKVILLCSDDDYAICKSAVDVLNNAISKYMATLHDCYHYCLEMAGDDELVKCHRMCAEEMFSDKTLAELIKQVLRYSNC